MKRLRALPKWQIVVLLVGMLLLLAAGGMLAWLGLRGPQVARIEPTAGSTAANPRAPIAIEFDQWMRTTDATDAITLDPETHFVTRWEGNTLLIEPERGLRYATDYRLKLDTSVSNVLGRPLDEPLSISFATVPYIDVEQVAPAHNTSGIAPHMPITVEFDRAVVPTDTIEAAANDPAIAADLPMPIRVHDVTTGEKSIAGSGRWLSPSFFGFYPAEDLHLATTYVAEVDQHIIADGTAALERPFSWEFTTTTALVQRVRPFDGAADVAADQPVEVELAAGVDNASAGDHFRLIEVSSGDPIDGQTLTSEDGFTFRPAAPLERGARYEARLEPGIRATNGAPINDDPTTWHFNVMGDLEVAQVEPQPTTTDVLTTTERISVRFNHPVVALTTIENSADLPQPLTFDPPIAGAGRWLDTRTYIWEPADSLPPATRFTARVDAGLTDQNGGTLAQPYEWDFTTIVPAVLATWPQSNARYADPQTDIQVTFNQPMDPASLGQYINVSRGGNPIAGTLAVTGAQATFTPATPLERGETYQITVDGGAPAAQGRAALGSSFGQSFRVAPLPALDETTPEDGATEASINHSIRLSFSTPMDAESVEQNIRIEPEPEEFAANPDYMQLDFYLNFPLQPETDYTITVGGDARDRFGVALGEDVTISFRTGPTPSELHFVGVGTLGAYNAYTPTRVLLRHTNIDNVSYKLYPLEPAQALQVLNDYSRAVMRLPAEARQPLQEDSLTLQGERNRLRLDALELGQLEAGLYRLEVRAESTVSGDRLNDWQVLAVSPYALTIKRSADELFVWAIDLDSGDPVADLSLSATSISHGSSGEAQLSTRTIGATNGEGISRAAHASEEAYAPLYVWSTAGDQFTFATTGWDSGISPWSFNVPGYMSDMPWVGHLHTERPLYRPGQTVHIRGALREMQGDSYALPPGDLSAELVINNPRYEPLHTFAVTPTEFGTFAVDFPIEPDMPLGSYSMRLDINNRYVGSGSFTVAEYRKPTFEVSVQPTAPDLIRGEMLEAEVEARYFASGALTQAPVRWRLIAEPYTFSSDEAPGYSFRDRSDPYAWYRGERLPAGGELIAEGQATTDAQGRLRLELSTDQGDTPGSRRLLLDVEVTDIDGQVIAAQGTVRVHAGAFYVGVRPEGYLARVGEPQDVSLITLDPQEQAVANQEIDIRIYRREWYSVRERSDDGRFYWTTDYDETLIETQRATTNEQGEASISFVPPEAGTYRIAAEGRDAQGRTISASAFSWAYGGDAFWGMDDTNRIELIADQTSYVPGDTARVLVPTPYEEMRGLLTIERGSIIEHRLITLQGTSEVLDVPITADYAPNVYVSLVLFKPAGDGGLPVPDMRAGLIELPVSTEQQELYISIEPDRAQAGPRDEVTYTVRTTTHSGDGVSAEVALALVDKAVLTLADDPNPSLLDTFYRERPLGVFTANTLTALVDRVTLRLEPGDKGGGGGGGGGALAELEARGNMPDTAYWNPAVVTGADGTARVTLTLPDNLTTWTMIARGLTTDTLVGQERHELISTRPLMVRPSLPRFLTAGDRPTLQAVVHNNTAEPIEATVTLDAGSLTLDDPAQQTIEVGADDQVLLQWQARVSDDALANGARQTVLRFSVAGGDLRDAVEHTLPLQRFVTPEVVASAGQVNDTPVVETLDLPADTNQEGSVTLELVPSLAAGMESGLDYLQHYPYACTEQTVSRFLPNAVTFRVFEQMGLEDPDLEDELRQNLAAGQQRLASLQNLDGGWGWWGDDGSQPYLTAYVIQGLLEAQRAGQPIEQQMLDDALDYLEDTLDSTSLRSDGPGWRANARAYVLYVLAEAGRPDRGRTIELFKQRHTLHIYGRAYLLMTFELLGGETERAATLVGELMSTAIVHPTTAHWEEPGRDYVTMSSDTRTTALALQALVRSDPDNYLIPGTVRHLMSLRDDGHWRTTQETALTLMALAEYLAASGELQADYTYQAVLDGETLREGSVGRDNLDETVRVVLALTELQADEPSRLLLQRQASGGQSGEGRLYYTLRARYTQEASNVQPLDRGFAVQRDYIAVDPATLEPTGRALSEVAVGEVVQVRLSLEVPDSVPYLVVEDMLPAGLEGLDTSLNTVTQAAQDAELTEADEPDNWRSWRHIDHTEMRDDRVALFATRLPSGSYEYTYLARATTPGTFQTLPTVAYQMYEPEVFGRSAGATFTVRQGASDVAQGSAAP